MRLDVEKEAVLYLFESEPGKAWHAGEIVKVLGFRGKQLKRFEKILHELLMEGVIEEGKNRRVFRLKEGGQTLKGTIRLMRSGAGIVADEEGKTYFVEQEDVGGALPGDTVAIRLKSGGDRVEPSARVTKILETSTRNVVGTLVQAGKKLFVSPLSPVYKTDFEVDDAHGAAFGDRVVVKVTERSGNERGMRAEIVDVIGPADKPSLDTIAIMKQYDLPEEFPPAVIREAEAVASLVDEPGERLDLRDEFIITIDPEKARDFDDAISLRILPNGQRELGVHIADVSHFVRPDSALDREAAKRSTSVYFVDRVIPMLPEQLSNGVCSLQPNVDRLAFSAFITFNDKGRPVSRRFAKTQIRSKLRLTYEQAMAMLDNKTPVGIEKWPEETVPLLNSVWALGKQLRKNRFANGGLELESPETEVLIDAEGRMTGIRTLVNDESHQLIEACMVAANEAVATELTVKGIKILARLHEPPDEEKIAEATEALIELGFSPGDLNQPKVLSKFLLDTQDHPLRYHAHMLLLRSLKRAVYSADAYGHFGLALKYYSHFTSPIRRYPDLTLHRQLNDYLVSGGKGGRMPLGYLQRTAQIATECEAVADEASRALMEIKKYRFLQQQLDDNDPVTYDAVIVKVKGFGMFVDVLEIQVSGMVHVSMISDQYVRYNEANESLNAGGVSYKAGMTIQVRVSKLDFTNRRADFEMILPESATPVKGRGGKSRNGDKPRERPERKPRAEAPARKPSGGQGNSRRRTDESKPRKPRRK